MTLQLYSLLTGKIHIELLNLIHDLGVASSELVYSLH